MVRRNGCSDVVPERFLIFGCRSVARLVRRECHDIRRQVPRVQAPRDHMFRSIGTRKAAKVTDYCHPWTISEAH